MNKRRFIYLPILIISMIICGCGQGTTLNTGDSPITGLDDGSVKVIREDVGPSQGGFLNLFMVAPETLNPLTTKSIYVNQLSQFVFDSLFCENEEGELVTSLVDSYSLSQDGLILDIDLKDNILYHDGNMLSADDVAFTLETIQKAGKRSLYIDHVSNIGSINVLNRLSLRIILKKADDDVVKKLTFPILPLRIFKDWPVEGHSETMKLIGTGPFIFDSYQGDIIKLIRNDSWWNKVEGSGKPIWIDGINFKIYSGSEEMLQAFQRQQIDIAWLEEGELESYSKRADIFFNTYESNILEFLVLSPIGNTDSPFSQESFRSIIVQYLKWYEGTTPFNKGKSVIGQPTYGGELIIEDQQDVIKALINEGFHYDDDRGYLFTYKDRIKRPIAVSIVFNTINSDRQSMSQWIAEALSKIGIQVNQEAASYDKQQSIVKSGKFDILLLGCNIPIYADDEETLELIKESLNISGNNIILPLYRKYGAVLYHNYIRGARKPIWKNIYNGWQEWYLVHSVDTSQ